MVVEDCSFETERLVVEGWHLAVVESLPAVVAGMLTPAVTRSLPPGWGGPYDEARAHRWIADRDAEGSTLLVSEGRGPVGLVLLHEASVPAGVVVRVGYLLAEHAWGRGLGGELVEGLVRWCREQASVRSIIGGVAPDNTASIRVLERNGFTATTADHASHGEREYRLDL